jgi:hypothetical protein
MWFCKECQGEVRKLMDRIKEVEKNNEILENKVKMLEEKWSNIKEDIVKETVNIVMDRIDANEVTRKAIDSFGAQMKQKEEKEKRVKNLVIYNIKESEKDNAEDRINDDKKMLNNIFENSLKVKDVEIVKVIRLGRREDGNENTANRKRPMLICMRDEDEKWKILKNAKNLKNEKNEEIKRIGISTDMTREEREESRKVRATLIEKRTNGETGWFIRGGKLMNKNSGQQ